MIEFTFSRMTLMVCGAILMAVVVVPLGGVFDSSEGDGFRELVERDASAIDLFWSSEMDELLICGSDLLPSPAYVLVAEGHVLKMVCGDKVYRGSLVHPLEVELGYGDEIVLVRDGDGLRTR